MDFVKFGYSIKDEMIEFIVRDTGIGIPSEFQNKIFDRFYQVDNAISRQYSGTGLGLSICKGYVELLGGTINVKSEPEKGTMFVIYNSFQKVLKLKVFFSGFHLFPAIS